MRVGLVCPYSLDVPGGVGWHCRDLAEQLIATGHEVSLLAPADESTAWPPYVVSAGRAVPVRYNGSVARVSFGPVSATRTRRWLEDGGFDVVHIHEPVSPSLSLLALWSADGPIVATFHTSNLRSRALQTAYPLLRPSLEKISARIAVSEEARQTVTTHIGGDAVVIPNGVYVDRFADAAPRPEWTGRPGRPDGGVRRPDRRAPQGASRPGRGAPGGAEVGARAARAGGGVRRRRGGSGAAAARRWRRPARSWARCRTPTRPRCCRSVDAYVAPHTGGESFGIVLVEAMAAGAPVVASDLPAFRRVLDDGRGGVLFRPGDPAALAAALVGLLRDRPSGEQLAAFGRQEVKRYDWPVVAAQVVEVYETVAPA